MWSGGRLASRVREGKEEAGAKFSDYFDFAEPFDQAALAPDPGDVPRREGRGARPHPGPGHRGDRRGPHRLRAGHRRRLRHRRPRPAGRRLARGDTVRWAWRTRILVHLGIDLRIRLRPPAEDEAVRVFAANLRDLLLAAPAGARATMGLDPGFRTGVKVAVVDATGKVVATETIYPHEPQRRWDESLATLAALAREHRVELIAIGNGTASRETDKLAGDLIKAPPRAGAHQDRGLRGRRLGVLRLRLRLAGTARTRRVAARRGLDRPPPAGPAGRAGQDRPQVDRRRPVPARPVRGEAVALARRGGRGLRERGRRRRQHRLRAAADAGSPASPARWRTTSSRTATPTARSARRRRSRTWPGSARRRSSSAPASCASPAATTRWTPPACTPRRTRWCAGSSPPTGGDIKALIGNTAALRSLQPAGLRRRHLRRADRHRHPRASWRSRAATRVPPSRPPPSRRASRSSKDLAPGMVLEGVVTNVAAFGAFVDVGVHQDGLVHVSAMSKTFVKDPRDVVKPGDVVRVKVLDVDIPRKRDRPDAAARRRGTGRRRGRRRGSTARAARPGPGCPGQGRPGQGRRRRPGWRRQGWRPARRAAAPEPGRRLPGRLRRAGRLRRRRARRRAAPRRAGQRRRRPGARAALSPLRVPPTGSPARSDRAGLPAFRTGSGRHWTTDQ